jgi:anti-sigma B factor antagonist
MGKQELIISEKRGNVGVVHFTTSQVLDELNVQQLGQELNDLVEKSYMVKMVINFDRIKFLSSAVLGKLISLHKRMQKEKGRMAFCNINKDVLQVFRITRLDKLIPIFENETDAVNAVENPALFGKEEMFK